MRPIRWSNGNATLNLRGQSHKKDGEIRPWDAGPRRMLIWNPARVLCIQDAHCRIPGILSAHTLLRRES
jgi:hypothetical protein